MGRTILEVTKIGRNVAIGIQNYNEIIEKNCFYVDKTAFIKEWWESMDSVTLITRPRRFGKTLNMSMVEQFFSMKYAGRNDLFEGKRIWEEENYRELQGRYVITSNRESGFGRYDVMLEPLRDQDDAIIIEFKVFNPRKERNLGETLKNALLQIEEKQYEAALMAKGIPAERIRKYGFAFEGKTVLIG